MGQQVAWGGPVRVVRRVDARPCAGGRALPSAAQVAGLQAAAAGAVGVR